MNTIRQTVEAVLSPSYMGYASEVLDALQEREDAITDGIRAYASGRGLSNHEIEQVLINVGLVQPEPEPEAPVSTGTDPSAIDQLIAQVRELGTTVASLVQAARDNGITIRR